MALTFSSDAQGSEKKAGKGPASNLSNAACQAKGGECVLLDKCKEETNYRVVSISLNVGTLGCNATVDI